MEFINKSLAILYAIGNFFIFFFSYWKVRDWQKAGGNHFNLKNNSKKIFVDFIWQKKENFLCKTIKISKTVFNDPSHKCVRKSGNLYSFQGVNRRNRILARGKSQQSKERGTFFRFNEINDCAPVSVVAKRSIRSNEFQELLVSCTRRLAAWVSEFTCDFHRGNPTCFEECINRVLIDFLRISLIVTRKCGKSKSKPKKDQNFYVYFARPGPNFLDPSFRVSVY